MRLTSSVFVALALVACRGGGNPPGDDDDTPDAPPVGGDVTIQEIQNDSMPVGTAVELNGVVVTAIDSFGARTGDIWVQEPGGAEFSGIKVFGAPLDIVATLTVGDLVNITNAEKDEFALTSDTSGRTTTEIKGAAGGMMSIVRTGPGTLPTPATVDAKAIDMLAPGAARDAEWEKWEGVLINVINVRQTGAVRSFGAGEDQFAFDASGDLVVESVLAAIGTNPPGTCYQAISGVGDYFFDYLLLPRATADLAAGGTDCTAQTVSSVSAVQMGTATGSVQLDDVIVTAIDDIGTSKGIWVADSLQGAQFNGVLVFLGNVTLDPQIVIGAKVDVIGQVQEFDVGGQTGDKLTEIGFATATFVSAPAGLPTPDATQTATVLADIGAPGEPYEGVLVQVANVKVTNINAGQGKVELTDNNGAKIIMDDDSFDWPDQVANTCYATLTGVMSVQLTDDIRTINPRALTDFVAGAGCN